MSHTISSCFAVASIAFSLLIGSHCLSQPTREELATQIDAYLTGQAGAGQFTGSILVADKGEVVISKAYGMANVELSVPNTPLTKFRIASLTKQFTAMAIMILQERGLLSVDDPISKHWPDCPRVWPAITIHHLLTHTSGIPNFTSLPGNFPDYWRAPRTVDETIALFRNLPLRFTPGTKWEYSNSGYVVLGKIIELLSDSSYEDFIKQNIFEPLGMSNSGYDHNSTIIPDRAAGYAMENNILQNAVHVEMDAAYAAGALYSTVEDLFLWDQSLYTTQLVSQPSLDAIFTDYTAATGTSYGYGWSVQWLFNRILFNHGGAVPGFSSLTGRFPEEGVFIVLLGNREALPVDTLWQSVAGMVKDVFDPLMAHWSLDETEGSTASDVARGHDAAVNGEPVWQPAAGMIGGALQLDGVDDHVSTPFVVSPADGPFSVFAWVKGGAAGQVVLSQANGANWLMASSSDGALMTDLKPAGRKAKSLTSGAVITDGAWHRVGLVWDGASRVLCVDDAEVARDTQASVPSSVGGLYIGSDSTLASGTFWKGLIDDVRVYDRAVKP